jgi:hypothetical protein
MLGEYYVWPKGHGMCKDIIDRGHGNKQQGVVVKLRIKCRLEKRDLAMGPRCDNDASEGCKVRLRCHVERSSSAR